MTTDTWTLDCAACGDSDVSEAHGCFEGQPEARITAQMRVDEQTDLLVSLEKALRSRKYTVQMMPDGIEVIHVDTGNLERKLWLIDVLADESERHDAH